MFARLMWRLFNRKRRSADLISAGVAAVAEPLLLVDDTTISAEMDQDQWFAILSSSGGLELRIPLDLHGEDAYLLARLESLEFALSGAPMVVASGEAPAVGALIIGVPREGDPGRLHVACQDCGGFAIDLIPAPHQPPPLMLSVATGLPLSEAIRISDRYRGAYARLCAYRFLYMRDQMTEEEPVCLGCIARDVRHGDLNFDGSAALWFDTDSSQWQLWQSLSEDQGVSLPLGITNFFTDPSELEAAAIKQINS